MSERGRILLVDDDTEIHTLVRHLVAPLGCDITSVRNAHDAIERLKKDDFDVVILDLMLPGPNGMEVLYYIYEQGLPTEVILLTAYASLENAAEAMRLGAYDYIPKPFDPPLLRSVIARALEQQRWKARLSAVYELSHRLALTFDTAQVAEAVLNVVDQMLGCDVCHLWMVDEANNEIRRLPRKPSPETILCPPRLPLDGEKGIVAAVARIGDTIYLPDVREDPRYVPSVEGIQSELAVPLLVKDRVIGVLNVESRRRDAFGPGDRQLLSVLANHTAVAIERARLYEEAHQRAEELKALNDITQVLTSTLDLQEVLTRVLTETRRLLGARAASVLLYEPEEDLLLFAASVGEASKHLVGRRMPADAGVAGWVLREQKPVLVHDTRTDPRFYDHIDALTGLTTRSLLAVPLTLKGEAVGVLEVVEETANAFDHHDLDLLVTLAGPAAIAIENARLYEETSHLLAEARVLQEVTLAAASTLDFDLALSRTIQAIRRTLHIDYLVFALPDESGESLTVHPSLIGFVSPSEEYLQLPLEESICGRVYTTGRPELVEDLTQDTHYFKETPELRSLLAVPVKVEHRIVAVLGAGSIRPGALTQDDLRLFEAIAAQLGIVMENARLYEAERELRKLVERSQAQLVMNERLAATGRMAASLAHEINNPLQAVHNSLQLMLTFPLSPEEQREYLQIAADEVKRLMNLVSRMLDFARRPRRTVKIVQINDLVEKSLALCNKYLQHHRITIRRDLSPHLPPVQANPDELSQVFLNLILNAVDAMPDGGNLHIITRPTEDGRVAISFTDMGHGIPEEYLERIFEPFFTTKEGGSGLGLSVSLDVVRRHGGEITVQSTEGKGATFTVLLPAAGANGEA